ncbi:MAG: ABC transporter permease [Lysobacteraceae bacterium]
MDIRPILSTLLRHKIAATLIVLEIALSCAIICNAVFLIGSRVTRIGMPSGVAENELVSIRLTGIGTDENAIAATREDLSVLRGVPGVVDAASANEVPFGQSSWNSSIMLTPDQKEQTVNATLYMGSESLRNTLGTRLVAGRDFRADEYVDFEPGKGNSIEPSTVIITRALAQRLFPGKAGVGEVLYFGDEKPVTVVGVVDHLVRPAIFDGDDTAEYSMLLPLRVDYTVGGYYLVRTRPGEAERVAKDAADALQRHNPNRIILENRPLADVRASFFRQDRSMAWLLVAVCVALLVVTALGIVGLASFWVQQRTKQIGVRRALGATRGQVLRYFQTENFLLATLGIAIGMFGAYAINQLLMSHYELPRLPALYLPVGALALWLLGQLSVLGPARRAAAVPPAVATRSV